MSIKPILEIKSKFQTGDIPVQADFEDLIDTLAAFPTVSEMPTLSTVAITGDYNDLINTPTVSGGEVYRSKITDGVSTNQVDLSFSIDLETVSDYSTVYVMGRVSRYLSKTGYPEVFFTNGVSSITGIILKNFSNETDEFPNYANLDLSYHGKIIANDITVEATLTESLEPLGVNVLFNSPHGLPIYVGHFYGYLSTGAEVGANRTLLDMSVVDANTLFIYDKTLSDVEFSISNNEKELFVSPIIIENFVHSTWVDTPIALISWTYDPNTVLIRSNN